MSDKDPDEVTITIGGKTFRGFDDMTLESAIDNLADAFVLSTPYDPENEDLDAQTTPFGYQKAEVRIGGELWTTGYVEKTKFTTNPTDSKVTLEGRSKAGQLVDCSIESASFEFNGLKLSEIAKKLCSPFGVEVVVGVDTVETRFVVKQESKAIIRQTSLSGSGASGVTSAQVSTTERVVENTLKEAKARVGQKVYDFLNDLANRKKILLTSDTLGRAVLRQPAGTGRPVAAIIAGKGNYIGGEATYDGTARFSKYVVLHQESGTPSIKGTAADSGVGIHRPMVDTESEADALDAVSPAEFQRAHALAKSIRVNVDWAGWRNDAGMIWRKADVVTLKAPKLKIKKETTFIVAGVTLKKNVEDGKKSSLRLVLPATYTGKMPRSNPW